VKETFYVTLEGKLCSFKTLIVEAEDIEEAERDVQDKIKSGVFNDIREWEDEEVDQVDSVEIYEIEYEID